MFYNITMAGNSISPFAGVVKLADATDSKSVGETRAGSSPATGTTSSEKSFSELCFILLIYAPVAQLDRVADFESVCRGFESLRACHVRSEMPIRHLGLFVIMQPFIPLLYQLSQAPGGSVCGAWACRRCPCLQCGFCRHDYINLRHTLETILD